MHLHIAVVHLGSLFSSWGRRLIMKKLGLSIWASPVESLGLLSQEKHRDIALIGELLILQGIWVPDASINASCCILLCNHKNDIGGTAGDP